MSALTDSFNRQLTYLRLSVTDLCPAPWSMRWISSATARLPCALSS